MNFFLYSIFLFFIGIECGILSWKENQHLKTYCGTKPGLLHQSSTRRSMRSASKLSACSASHDIYNFNGNNWVFTQNNNLFYVTNQKDELISEQVSKIILFNYCYRADVNYDDMMIWELKEDIRLNDFAQPACISNNPSLQATYTNVRLTSYGHNNTNFDNTDRKGIYMLRKGDFVIESLANMGRAFTIVDQHQKYSVRPGDSGGSVINDVNGRHYVIGVASRAIGSDPFRAEIASVYAHFNQICQYTGVC
ncbi:hypothetical protein B9Z55_026019 [Caenorhabditis nigoni]|uniref:Peptidase S1 domain-containing protein n=1 Tax=Caenorhabditis nigoni TaxID=1611254 RepID=A0A2G5T0W7_9PELO|nr:hypothetical protein B9Z55_026019 [Caenorhabditis nigoni]